MYKIYINETPLILISTDELERRIYPREKVIIAPYLGKKKFLLHYIDNLEKSKRYEAIVIHYKNIDILFKDFMSLFKLVKAANK